MRQFQEGATFFPFTYLLVVLEHVRPSLSKHDLSSDVVRLVLIFPLTLAVLASIGLLRRKNWARLLARMLLITFAIGMGVDLFGFVRVVIISKDVLIFRAVIPHILALVIFLALLIGTRKSLMSGYLKETILGPEEDRFQVSNKARKSLLFGQRVSLAIAAAIVVVTPVLAGVLSTDRFYFMITNAAIVSKMINEGMLSAHTDKDVLSSILRHLIITYELLSVWIAMRLLQRRGWARKVSLGLLVFYGLCLCVDFIAISVRLVPEFWSDFAVGNEASTTEIAFLIAFLVSPLVFSTICLSTAYKLNRSALRSAFLP